MERVCTYSTFTYCLNAINASYVKDKYELCSRSIYLIDTILRLKVFDWLVIIYGLIITCYFFVAFCGPLWMRCEICIQYLCEYYIIYRHIYGMVIQLFDEGPLYYEYWPLNEMVDEDDVERRWSWWLHAARVWCYFTLSIDEFKIDIKNNVNFSITLHIVR